MPLFIKFVLMCFCLVIAAYFISSSGSPLRNLICKHWRVIDLTQTPNPFDTLPTEELEKAQFLFNQKIQTSFINFMKQGNYESQLLNEGRNYGIWSINKDVTELTLENNGIKETLYINELTENKLILTRKRIGEEITVVLIPIT